MKRISALLTVLLVAHAQADTATVSGVTYTYTISDGKASIYSGYNSAISTSTSGALEIPRDIDGYPVTSIGAYAFFGCSGLTSVTIPDAVTSIGECAFYNCSGLTNVLISASVTNLGDRAFVGCTGLLSITVAYENSTYSSVNGMLLSKDGSVLVQGVNGDVIIPDSVRHIGEYAFYCFSGLTSVIIPSTVTCIGGSAFHYCGGLTSVKIPDSVASIGDRAFYYCKCLTSVTIGDSVTSIGDSAFLYCSGLTNVQIPASVTSIGDHAFAGCAGLLGITVASGNLVYSSANGMLLSKDGTVLVQGVNGNVAIPGTVTNISGYAFSDCRGLASVEIPDSVTSIGDYAFASCSGLTNVTIPNSVMRIGTRAFFRCSNLASVTMKYNAPNVDGSAFSGIDSSCVVLLPNGNETYTVTAGKWQGMTVAWYDKESKEPLGTANGVCIAFSDGATGRTATVAEGTSADDIVLMLGDKDVTRAYKRSVEGTTATIALISPFEVELDEKRQDAASPWEENGDGTVTLNVEVVPGLYYAAASAASLGDLKCPGADKAAAAGMTLTVAKPASDTQGFYKVWVSDAPMAAE